MYFNQFYLPFETNKGDVSIDEPFLASLIPIILKNSRPIVPTVPTEIENIQKSPPLKDIKAVVFDIYGTLLHSAAGEIQLMDFAQEEPLSIPELRLTLDPTLLAEHIYKEVQRAHARIKSTTSITCPEIDVISMWVQLSNNRALFPKTLNMQEAALCALYYELRYNPSWPMPHAIETLLQLQRTPNILLGIVSNAQFYTPLILHTLCAHCNPQWQEITFPIQIWSYIQGEAKPSLQLFELLCAQCMKLGIQPEQVLYIGNDKLNDIMPAQKSRVHSLLFAGDSLSYRPRKGTPLLHDVRPDGTITKLRDILDIIGAPTHTFSQENGIK